MSSLQRYLLHQLVVATAVAAVTVTATISLTQSVHMIKLALENDAGLDVLLRISAMLVPSFLIISLPISVLLAVAFVYGKMIGDLEIVAMRTSGLSHVDLAAPALVLAGAVTVIAYTISLYFMPISMRGAKDMTFAVRIAPVLLLREGVFNDIKPGLTVYFKVRRNDGTMTDVLIYDARNEPKSVMLTAKHAILKMSERQAKIVLFDGTRQEQQIDQGDVAFVEFDRASLSLDLSAAYKRPRNYYHPSEKFVWQLLDPANAADDPQRRDRDRAAGHSRLAAPLYAIGFALIALAATLAPSGGRRGNRWLVFAAMIAFAAVQAGAFGAMALVEAFPAAAPLIYANALLPVLVGYLLLRRFDKRAGLPFQNLQISPRQRTNA